MRILMVCLGNICRSPIAEGVLRNKARIAGLDWQIDSAGTETYHIGEPPHRFSQKVCLQNGVDISEQRARRFVSSDLRNYDKIYAMAGDVMQEIRQIAGPAADYSKLSLFLDELHPGKHESVPDPWSQTEEAYPKVYALINECCNAIIGKYSLTSPTP